METEDGWVNPIIPKEFYLAVNEIIIPPLRRKQIGKRQRDITIRPHKVTRQPSVHRTQSVFIPRECSVSHQRFNGIPRYATCGLTPAVFEPQKTSGLYEIRDRPGTSASAIYLRSTETKFQYSTVPLTKPTRLSSNRPFSPAIEKSAPPKIFPAEKLEKPAEKKATLDLFTTQDDKPLLTFSPVATPSLPRKRKSGSPKWPDGFLSSKVTSLVNTKSKSSQQTARERHSRSLDITPIQLESSLRVDNAPTIESLSANTILSLKGSESIQAAVGPDKDESHNNMPEFSLIKSSPTAITPVQTHPIPPFAPATTKCPTPSSFNQNANRQTTQCIETPLSDKHSPLSMKNYCRDERDIREVPGGSVDFIVISSQSQTRTVARQSPAAMNRVTSPHGPKSPPQRPITPPRFGQVDSRTFTYPESPTNFKKQPSRESSTISETDISSFKSKSQQASPGPRNEIMYSSCSSSPLLSPTVVLGTHKRIPASDYPTFPGLGFGTDSGERRSSGCPEWEKTKNHLDNMTLEIRSTISALELNEGGAGEVLKFRILRPPVLGNCSPKVDFSAAQLHNRLIDANKIPLVVEGLGGEEVSFGDAISGNDFLGSDIPSPLNTAEKHLPVKLTGATNKTADEATQSDYQFGEAVCEKDRKSKPRKSKAAVKKLKKKKPDPLLQPDQLYEFVKDANLMGNKSEKAASENSESVVVKSISKTNEFTSDDAGNKSKRRRKWKIASKKKSKKKSKKYRK